MILGLIDLTWPIILVVIIIAAIIGWYLLKFAIWILIVIILAVLIFAGLDLVFGFISSLF